MNQEEMSEEQARLCVREILTLALSQNADSNTRVLIDEATEDLLPIWEVPAIVNKSPNEVSAFMPFHYVIPSQDLKLIETAFAVLTAAAGSSYFVSLLGFDPTKSVTAAITGIVVAVVRLLNNLKLSVHLEQQEYAIMTVLAGARQEGLAEDALLRLLQKSYPHMTIEDIERCLETMLSCVTVSGTKTALVWKDGRGNWHTNGI